MAPTTRASTSAQIAASSADGGGHGGSAHPVRVVKQEERDQPWVSRAAARAAAAAAAAATGEDESGDDPDLVISICEDPTLDRSKYPNLGNLSLMSRKPSKSPKVSRFPPTSPVRDRYTTSSKGYESSVATTATASQSPMSNTYEASENYYDEIDELEEDGPPQEFHMPRPPLPHGNELQPIHRDGRFFCPMPECVRNKGFFRMFEFQRHVNRTRSHGGMPFTCNEPNCFKTFPRLDSWQRHQRQLHPMGAYARTQPEGYGASTRSKKRPRAPY